MMPMLVMTGSARTAATSRAESAVSSAAISLNSITLVVSQRIDLRPHVVGARHGRAFFVERDEGFVHGAVIAIVEDQHFGAPGDHARHAQGMTIGVGGGERELPVRKSEAALEFLANPDHIFVRQHERDAFLDLLGDGFDRGFGRVTGHCACVAEAKVNVGIAVHVGEVRAFGFLDKDGK